MIDLDTATRQCIRRTLAEYAPGTRGVLVGSRANGPAKRYADIDLLILDDRPLSTSETAALRSAFEESDIPCKVDIMLASELTPVFRRALMQHYARI